uniref:Uncharacterized protein n=1 Tax=Timema douglasi TaxID=61478 RepID=A0A7R8ZE72_TIMDO|nr:unnamed protein product [Timema douglasi]
MGPTKLSGAQGRKRKKQQEADNIVQAKQWQKLGWVKKMDPSTAALPLQQGIESRPSTSTFLENENFTKISRVNEQLQHKDMTVDRAVSHLTGLKDALQDIRDTGIDVILDEASNICAATSLGIDCFFEEKRVKKRKRLTLEESEDTVLTGKQRFSIQYDDTINCSAMIGRKWGGCVEGAPMLLFAPGANYSNYGPANSAIALQYSFKAVTDEDSYSGNILIEQYKLVLNVKIEISVTNDDEYVPEVKNVTVSDPGTNEVSITSNSSGISDDLKSSIQSAISQEYNRVTVFILADGVKKSLNKIIGQVDFGNYVQQ